MGGTSRNEEERATWRMEVSKLPMSQLVSVEECGSTIALTPISARVPKGQRARGSVPRNSGKHIMLNVALSLDGLGAAMILEESANAATFETYVEQILAPSLEAGQIVVMDNLRARKGGTGAPGHRGQELPIQAESAARKRARER